MLDTARLLIPEKGEAGGETKGESEKQRGGKVEGQREESETKAENSREGGVWEPASSGPHLQLPPSIVLSMLGGDELCTSSMLQK